MKPHQTLLPAALAVLLLPALALAAAPAHDHAHGAPATAAASPEMSTDAATPAAGATREADAAALLLERMRDLHARLTAARSAGERQKLLSENRGLMQQAMSLLNAPAAERGKMMGMGNPEAGDQAMNRPGDMPEGAATGKNKAPGGMDMQQCQEMHAAMGRHMALMHALLQALVDQQTAGLPSR